MSATPTAPKGSSVPFEEGIRETMTKAEFKYFKAQVKCRQNKSKKEEEKVKQNLLKIKNSFEGFEKTRYTLSNHQLWALE